MLQGVKEGLRRGEERQSGATKIPSSSLGESAGFQPIEDRQVRVSGTFKWRAVNIWGQNVDQFVVNLQRKSIFHMYDGQKAERRISGGTGRLHRLLKDVGVPSDATSLPLH